MLAVVWCLRLYNCDQQLNQSFPFVGRRDHHGFAIFRNGAPGNLDILFFQYVGNFTVAQWFFGIFCRDQLFDDGANGGGGAFAAGTGADMTGEEVLELKYTPVRETLFDIPLFWWLL